MRTPPSFVCIISGGEYFWIYEQFIDFFLFFFSVHKLACVNVCVFHFIASVIRAIAHLHSSNRLKHSCFFCPFVYIDVYRTFGSSAVIQFSW